MMEKYLIIDIDTKIDIKKEVKEFGLTIINAEAITRDLLCWKGWKKFDPQSTLIVLPGNGASIVKKYISKIDPSWLSQWLWKFFPYAKRVWVPGENPRTFVSRITPKQMLISVRNVVVVDDVISSGATIRNLRQINEPWIPGADWQAVTWVKQKSANTKGFFEIFANKTVGARERKAPINSLSTLIECREIAESYAQRNFGTKAESFLKLLEFIR